MKKVSVSCFLTVLTMGLCLAQSPIDAVSQDPCKAAGSFYVYDYKDAPVPTPSPDGYRPFYISHFGRHGARYCTSEYDALHGWLTKAAEAGCLTEEGRALYSRFEKYYQKVRYCRGNLTGIGKDQHRSIGMHMYQWFPQVFEGSTHVEAVSTESPRVIMSMWSCLSSLQALDKDIDFSADASAKYAPWLQPSLSTNPYLIKDGFKVGKEAEEKYKEYFEQTVPWKEITERFFTSADVLNDVLKISQERFIEYLHGVVTCTRCIDHDQAYFDNVFSKEELLQVWKGTSAGYFLAVARYEGSQSLVLDYAAFTLDQIIEAADADISSGSTQLRLRFGHDSGIAPLMAVLDVNGYGRSTASFEEALEIYPSYNIPMGASLQLVFYRNDAGDVLVKVLVNEREATLPLTAVSGPYYKWSDFKAHYQPIVADSKRKVTTAEPLAILRNTDWGWQTIAGTRAEYGAASVKVFGSTQSISIARFPIGEHSISVVESDGPSAMITSDFGEKNRALAAINGSYFSKQLMPVTYVKDEGKVVSTSNADGVVRCNAMLRIKDRKGKIIDIISVDAKTNATAAKGWREAIVSGPILLEDGKPVLYKDDGSKSYRNFYVRRHPRSILGYTADGWVYFIVVDGRFPSQADGMNISELTVLCEALGLYEALNLDGGGSSTLWTRGQGVLNHPYDNKVFDHSGQRIVPNAIIVK